MRIRIKKDCRHGLKTTLLAFALLLGSVVGLSPDTSHAATSLSWSKTSTGKYNNSFDCPFKKVTFNYNASMGTALFDIQFYPNHCNQDAIAGDELGLGMAATCKYSPGYTTLLGEITASLQDMTQWQPLDLSGETTGIDSVYDGKYGMDGSSSLAVSQISGVEYQYLISGPQMKNRKIGCASIRTHSNLDMVSKDWWCNCWTTGDTTWAVLDIKR